MFKVKSPWGVEVLTVYAVDKATNSFLVAEAWGEFYWVDMGDYRLYEEDSDG